MGHAIGIDALVASAPALEVVAPVSDAVAASSPLRRRQHSWMQAPYHVRLFKADGMAIKQRIRLCTAHDGVRLAYATTGQGPKSARSIGASKSSPTTAAGRKATANAI